MRSDIAKMVENIESGIYSGQPALDAAAALLRNLAGEMEQNPLKSNAKIFTHVHPANYYSGQIHDDFSTTPRQAEGD